MNTTRDEKEMLEERLIRWEDGELGPEETEGLIRLLQENKSARRDLVKHYLLDVGIARELNAGDAENKRARSLGLPGPRLSGRRWVIPLAAAASLTIAVGGAWWFNRTLAGSLVLRVAEMKGSGFRVQGSGGAGPGVQGPESGVLSPIGLRVDDVIRPGDGVEVGADGVVKLAYRDGTQVELQRNTRLRVGAATGADKEAKRLALDAGTLIGSAAPQRHPLEIQTPHAVARVVGTRLRLEVAAAKSTLTVTEGKVELCRGEKTLLVSIMETAVASAEGLKRLSPEDVWTRELLARAEAGAWDALDFAKCVTHEKDAAWLVENPGKAGNRLWRTNPKLSNHVLFESARWKRGVVVGQVMLLPEGNL
ncbi:MAG: FecR family protein, partial [bacterium]